MNKERRRYFRISDEVRLSFERVPAEQLDARIREFHGQAPESGQSGSDALEREKLLSALAAIKLSQPEIGQVLDGLLRQIDRTRERCCARHGGFANPRTVQADLSAQGIAFESTEMLSCGDMVEMHLQLTAESKLGSILARTVRCDKAEGGSAGYHLALDFEHILEADRQRIVAHVMALQRQALSQSKHVGRQER